MNITKRTMKTEKYFALPPIVDFEAVFIADEPRVAAQVIPTFAYRDVEGVQFLGNATWNSPELIARAQTQVEGALFPDVFQPVTSTSESNLAATRFRTDYRATFHQEPSATDALAYDAGGILKAILRTLPENAPRSEIREKIRKLEEYSGAAGRISADENGRLKRKLQIIEIRGGKFILAR
jgi:ABC-type branched-subunit amino acid transport system substrate-binding protein